jgi:Tfp pilus assembly protein PilN
VSQQINLFNPIFLKQKKHFSAITMAQALGIIAVGCLLIYAYSSVQLAKRTTEASDTAAQVIKTKDQLIAISTQFGEQKNNQALDAELIKAQADIKSLQQVFDEIQSGNFGDTNGYSSYFRGFSRQIIDGVWLSGIRIEGAGHDINLRGHATSPQLIPAYLARLRREADMQGKSFSELAIDRPKEEKPADGSAKSVVPAAAPAYVDFNLQSSDAKTGGAEK